MKVSVIIPVYNTEQYIPRCLDSILSQTFQDFEIIIVNDRSPDNSLKILKEYQQNDSRIRVISNERNMGLMWTRRVGYRMALGEYIVFCDSDDYLPNTALESLYNAIQLKKVDIVVASYTYVTVKGNRRFEFSETSRELSQEEIYKELLSQKFSHSLWAKIYNKRLFLDFEYETFENHTNGEDLILFYQLINNTNKVAIIEDSVYFYCQNLSSSTHQKFSEKHFRVFVKNLNWLYSYLKNNTLYTDLLNYRLLFESFVLLKLGIPDFILDELEANIKKLFSLSLLLKYLGFVNGLYFYILYKSRRIFNE